jgi:hypothetical protein
MLAMSETKYIVGDELPEHHSVENGVLSLLFAMGCLLLLGLGIPILLIYYIKSPPIDQLTPIMGISFSRLVYIYLVSAAIITYTSVLFLKAGPAIIFSVFAISLYCCFPFIMGLRNNLHLKEAIIDTPLLSHLPFFLKPAYLFFEFMIPAGVLTCLFLQMKNIFSKKVRSFTFLSLACFLGTAAVLGFSILTQADIPNLVSIAKWSRHELLLKQDMPQTYPIAYENRASPSAAEKHAGDTFRIPDSDKEPVSQPDVAGLHSYMAIPEEVSTVDEINQKFQQLSAKLDHVINIMNQKSSLLKDGQDQTAGPTNSDNQPRRKEAPSVAPPATQSVNSKAGAEDIEQKLQQVSTSLTGIAEAISRMEAIMLPEYAMGQQKTMNAAQAPSPSDTQTQITQKNKPVSDNKEANDMAQELSQISTKIDLIWETLSHDKKSQRSLQKIQ